MLMTMWTPDRANSLTSTHVSTDLENLKFDPQEAIRLFRHQRKPEISSVVHSSSRVRNHQIEKRYSGSVALCSILLDLCTINHKMIGKNPFPSAGFHV